MPPASPRSETQVIEARYWAAAKQAAGVEADQVPVEGPVTLADLQQRVLGLHPGARLGDVLAVCSVLVDDRPVSSEDPGDVVVSPGSVVQFLPPFAGG
ncbi:MoaD/ThiS family protein [Nocardioides sp. CPCC 205120]|uniref:MoaD/ThiS family protein n=1 Tax=Nocardioides sp. CPCC 205120 TaxID=3406462 RepID=UPI003B5041C5